MYSRGDREVKYLRSEGHVGVYVSVLSDDKTDDLSEQRLVIGVLGILDSIEANAKSTIAALKALNIDVWMCTGDHDETAKAVAHAVGINAENVCSNVSPEGKADLITRLQRRRRENDNSSSGGERRGKVAVVGDGINDSVALARADVGIAIGAGTEVAVEAADIVLVRSNLHDVVVALHLSRVVFNRIKMNFVWAVGYNLFALPFAAGLFYPWTQWRVPPAFAGFMMAFSSVSVVTSSLLLRAYAKPIVNEDGTIYEQGCFPSCHRMWSVLCLLPSIFKVRQAPSKRGWTSVENHVSIHVENQIV
jgi:Cu+-exporting ATPase